MLDKTKAIRKEVKKFTSGAVYTSYTFNCKICLKEINLSISNLRKSKGYCKVCCYNNKSTKYNPEKDINGKYCKNCDRVLSIEKFIKRKGEGEKGYSTLCSKCHNLKKFGINSLYYEKLLLLQNGTCAICSNTEDCNDKHKNYKRALAVDHCHTTGKVRGLLCTYCNTAIGALKDNVELLENAIKYLNEQYK